MVGIQEYLKLCDQGDEFHLTIEFKSFDLRWNYLKKHNLLFVCLLQVPGLGVQLCSWYQGLQDRSSVISWQLLDL